MKILNGKKDAELFDIILRLLVNLTQSAYNCFEQKLPEEKIQHNIYMEIDNRLKQVKESFADDDFIQTLCNKLNSIIDKAWEDRPEEEELVVERILFLVRNILQIKSNNDEASTRLESDLNSHDRIIHSLHKSKLLDSLIRMASIENDTKYAIHLLEIFVLVLKEQSPEELAKVSESEAASNMMSKRSMLEKEKDNDELIRIQQRDQQERKHNKIRINPRHSRFMGTYVAVNMKSINDDNKLIVHKQARNMDDLLDESSKKVQRKAKNRIGAADTEIERQSVLYIRVILKKFCTSVFEKCYKALFRNLKDLVSRKKLEDEEIAYYYWLIRFLTEFNRNLPNVDESTKLAQIMTTFAMDLFHSIEIYVQRCIEMMKVEKKQLVLWTKRMHVALKCYKENLITLYSIEKKLYATQTQTQKKPTQQQGGETRELTEEELVAMAEGDSPKKSPGDDLNDDSLNKSNESSNSLEKGLYHIEKIKSMS